MKAIIEAKVYFPKPRHEESDNDDVKVEVVASPDEDLDRGQILIIHPKMSIELSAHELRAVLRMYEGK